MSAKIQVKTQKWVNGSLELSSHFFENEEEAISFAKNTSAHIAKVYNEDGELLHTKSLSVSPAPEEAGSD